MGQAIPLQTRILIQVSDFFIDYWWAVLAAPVIACVRHQGRGPSAARRSATGSTTSSCALPLLGPILRKIILSRFASIFAMMYSLRHHHSRLHPTSEEIAGNLVIKEGLRSAPASRSPRART